ncbi:MAG: VOC family protein [Actinobacteria bacterium]|nr:VOC family protein [Actinomycetota bacterium]
MITRLSHVALGVSDSARMLDFYGGLFGVVEVERRGETLYLSGGTKGGFDLSLEAGEPGVDHFAFAVRDAAALVEAGKRLAAAGVDASNLAAGSEPGIEAGIAFALPSGHAVELVLESDRQAFRPTASIPAPHHQGAGPVPLEHITLNCGDVQVTAEFLIGVLGLRLSESIRPDGSNWFNAFLRAGHRHHDVAFFASDDGDVPGLNHFCFAVPAVEDLVRVADLAAGMGIVLDCSIGRHVNGNNVFIYLKDPEGNRVEVNTDMAEIDPAAPPRIGSKMEFDVWRESIPPAMLTASRCRDARVAGGV